MSLSVTTPHLNGLHLNALHLQLPGRLPVATVLLSLLYAAAFAVALSAPGQHAAAGCVVLAGLVGRTVVRRRRTATVALTPQEAVAPAAP